MKTLFYTVLFGLMSLSTFSQNNADRIIGCWLNDQKNAEIEIYRQDNKYYGKVLKITALEKMEIDNLPEAVRVEKIKNIQGEIILKKLIYNNNNRWINGTFIAPKKNQELSCSLTITADKNTLNIDITKGWFSKTINWTRISN